jgi:SPP1 gp7 family putative phage head morphogenesis protein
MAAYQTDQRASKFNLEFFNKSAIPSAILKTTQKLSKEQHERLAKQVERKYSGVANAHKTMILESGLDYQPMTISQREMDFIESRKFNRDEILAVFRVPRTILGITDDVNRANAEASDYVFMSRTIKPEMRRFTEALNEFFIPLFKGSETLFFSFEDPTPENKDLLIKQANDGLLNGYITINESRALLGYEPVEGGDVLAPRATDPLILSYRPKKKDKDIAKAGKHATIRQKKKETIEKGIAYAEKILTETFTKIAKDQLRKERKVKNMGEGVAGDSPFKGTKEQIDIQKKEYQLARIKIMDEQEESIKIRMRRIFRAQKRQILNDFPEKADVPKGFPHLDLDTEVQVTADTLRPAIKKIIIKQSKPAYQIIGIDRELSAAAAPVANYLSKKVFRLSKDITEETNSLLGRALADGVSQGESIPQLRKRVQELFTGMESYRGDRIARTETARASTFASQTAWEESGLVAGKEWLTAIDERTHEGCLAMNGVIVPLEGTFKTEEGPLQSPPMHVNCRCDTAPIIKR